MSCEAIEHLDVWIRRAMQEGCEEVAAAYDAIGTEDVFISERLDRLVYRLIRRRENAKNHARGMHIVGRALICAILASLMILTLVITIAAARGELISTLVKWYDDHVSVHFGEIEEKPGDGMLPAAPTYLKDMYEPCIVGYTRKCERLDDINYETFVLGYYDDVQVPVCKYQQAVWRMDLSPTDLSAYEVCTVEDGDWKGTLYTEKTSGNLILLWDDGCYHYRLQSDIFIAEDLIGWAQNMAVAYNVMPSPVVDIRRPVIDSPVITSQVIKQSADYISTDYYRNGAFVCRFIQRTSHKIDGGVQSEGWGDPQKVADIVIGRHVGLAYIYSGKIQVIWEDDEYEYRMQSSQMTLKEMIRWCETTRSVEERFAGIRQILSPRGLSPDIEERVFEKSRRRVEIDYYRDGKCICAYTQMILSTGVPAKGNGYEEVPVRVHHAQGILRRYEDGKLVMVWNDDSYRYRLVSEHLSEQELMEWALSIAPPFEIEELRKPVFDDQVLEYPDELTDTGVQYSYAKDGRRIAVFRQLVMNARGSDYEGGCIPLDISVGDHRGVVLLYGNGKTILIWTDKTYSYELESNVLSLEDLLVIGASVKPVDEEEQEPETPKDPPMPEELQQIYLPDYEYIRCTAKEIERSDTLITTEFYRNDTWVATLTQSIMSPGIMEYTSGYIFTNRGKQDDYFCYDISVWDGKSSRIIRIWTDGQYKYRLEIDERYKNLMRLLTDFS